jgi:hypothetical protein
MTAPYEKAAEETAKAVGETAKAAGKLVDAVREFAAFTRTVLGDGFAELGGAFADWTSAFRYEQAVKLAERVRRVHQRRGVAGHTVPIPPRLGIPLLQQATLEDDSTLLDMWAGLISNATDPNRRTEARRSFCGLLSSMEPLDALVLRELYVCKIDNLGRELIKSPYSMTEAELAQFRRQWPSILELPDRVGSDRDSLSLALENLERLGLIFDYRPQIGAASEDAWIIPGQKVLITDEPALIDLTHTGVALMRACSADPPLNSVPPNTVYERL